jgi:hypothetical protein
MLEFGLQIWEEETILTIPVLSSANGLFADLGSYILHTLIELAVFMWRAVFV